MEFKDTIIKDCFTIKPKVFKDDRGYFFESYNQKLFDEKCPNVNFVQDNQSYSTKGTLRGLHYQKGEHAQAKLVRALKGTVLDVVVDLRVNSPSFGKHVAVELSAENGLQLFAPKGCAHGFVVLSEDAIFTYKCDNFYNKSQEGGIIYNDKDLNIDWQLKDTNFTLSAKDLELISFKEYKEDPCF